MLNLNNYNPDVLTCLANLSSDEVFTPPERANEVLDLLPRELWEDPKATFLDPGCKSGVFLREMAKRLDAGLEKKIPDRQERLNHIFKNQLFGIAITELTSLLSRRSTYCSKKADGKYSICEEFTSSQGNILYDQIEHVWLRGRCEFCRANEENYDRRPGLEAHAYQFIHTANPEEIFDMRFDVIVGNPPYQLNDGGGNGKAAMPIYHKFVQQAKKLNPRFLTMIIPSRWFGGGRGLKGFRAEMLADDHIRKIVDYEDARECFPGVDVAGGICYFLWDRDSAGLCETIEMHKGKRTVSTRPLNEFDTFIRHSGGVEIIRKVTSKGKEFLNEQVSSLRPFHLRTNVEPLKKGDILLRWKGGTGPYKRDLIKAGVEMIDQWKVVFSKVSYDHAGQPDKNGMRKVFSVIEVLPPGTVCTETYIVAGAFNSERPAKNLATYLRTRLVRFLVAQLSFSHDIFKGHFVFVPKLKTSVAWTDQKLYEEFSIKKDEQEFIESKIRPWD